MDTDELKREAAELVVGYPEGVVRPEGDVTFREALRQPLEGDCDTIVVIKRSLLRKLMVRDSGLALDPSKVTLQGQPVLELVSVRDREDWIPGTPVEDVVPVSRESYTRAADELEKWGPDPVDIPFMPLDDPFVGI